MVNVKEAVKIAFEYINNLYIVEDLHDIALEEVELSKDERYWLVTVGFTRVLSQPLEQSSSRFETFAIPVKVGVERVYKILQIDANSREVKSMKIREL